MDAIEILYYLFTCFMCFMIGRKIESNKHEKSLKQEHDWNLTQDEIQRLNAIQGLLK